MTSIKCSHTKNQLLLLFKKAILGKRARCGYCGSFKVRRTKDNRFWCRKCRKRFSLKSASFLKGSRLPLDRIYCLLDCWLQEMPVKQTARLTNLSRQTVSRYFRKFRLVVPELKEKLNGSVIVMDDSYFGGKRKGKRGRGATGKTLVFGALDQQASQIKVFELESMDFRVIATCISHHTNREAKFISDDYSSYQYAASWLKTVNVFINHAVRFKETNPIENVWSVFKNKLIRMYHHATKRYMFEYIKELAYRFNSRLNPDDPFAFIQKTLQLQSVTASYR
ncbi:MAG: hypothetical protein COT41_00260 [Candidatus Portnoybacteria bacterium CG08_land_8_20_14_0_20_40_83]|nr:MAG: hypothetical protein COT41_00260 [Candidatus Portnoybacteria bacterium CG08_land_8_20_14_0_20_40_83]